MGYLKVSPERLTVVSDALRAHPGQWRTAAAQADASRGDPNTIGEGFSVAWDTPAFGPYRDAVEAFDQAAAGFEQLATELSRAVDEAASCYRIADRMPGEVDLGG